MALTEKVRLLVEAKGFRQLFEDNEEVWSELANDARDLIKPQIQDGNPTVDDIKLIALPLIELHELYRDYMEEHPKLKEKYWIGHFTDYALHRIYKPTLDIPEEEEENE
jgi:hypothetical protein